MAVPNDPETHRNHGPAVTPLPPITPVPSTYDDATATAKEPVLPAAPRDPGKTISIVLLVLGLLVMLYAVIVVGRALG